MKESSAGGLPSISRKNVIVVSSIAGALAAVVAYGLVGVVLTRIEIKGLVQDQSRRKEAAAQEYGKRISQARLQRSSTFRARERVGQNYRRLGGREVHEALMTSATLDKALEIIGVSTFLPEQGFESVRVIPGKSGYVVTVKLGAARRQKSVDIVVKALRVFLRKVDPEWIAALRLAGLGRKPLSLGRADSIVWSREIPFIEMFLGVRASTLPDPEIVSNSKAGPTSWQIENKTGYAIEVKWRSGDTRSAIKVASGFSRTLRLAPGTYYIEARVVWGGSQVRPYYGKSQFGLGGKYRSQFVIERLGFPFLRRNR